MVAAVLRREEIGVEYQAPTQSRDEVLARYRSLRQISKRHHSKAMDLVSPDAILHHARRLGLAQGKTFILGNMDELTLAVDLAVYTAPPGRTRALERCVRSAQFAPGSDEARVIQAMGHARFAVGLAQRRHEAAGLIVTDLLRETEFWLVDEGLEVSLPEGTAFVTRYYTPYSFSMTAGFGVRVDRDLLDSALDAAPQLQRKSRAELVADRRFAEAVYRAAILAGIAAGMRYQDPPGTIDAAGR